MELNLQIRFYTDKTSWLCFRHAVERAMKGEQIHMEIGDFDSDYFLGTKMCADCEEK